MRALTCITCLSLCACSLIYDGDEFSFDRDAGPGTVDAGGQRDGGDAGERTDGGDDGGPDVDAGCGCDCPTDECNDGTCTPTGLVDIPLGAADRHGCAIRMDGRLVCWGDFSLLGGLPDMFPTADAVLPGTITSGELGRSHMCVIARTDRLFCWGENGDGQLGIRTTVDEPMPQELVEQYVDVSAGIHHTCAIRSSGEPFCWGLSTAGELGPSAAVGTVRNEPIQVSPETDWIEISVGFGFTCGLRDAGVLECWGDNSEFQLGEMGTSRSSPVAVEHPRMLPWGQVCTGRSFACARDRDGMIYCWGAGELGQIGNGRMTDVAVPAPIAATGTFVDVTCGRAHACAVRDDQRLRCWGAAELGQVGPMTMPMSTTQPTPVGVGSAGWVDVEAGGPGSDTTCATRTDGTLWCWGSNDTWQTGRRSPPDEVREPARVCIPPS